MSQLDKFEKIWLNKQAPQIPQRLEEITKELTELQFSSQEFNQWLDQQAVLLEK